MAAATSAQHAAKRYCLSIRQTVIADSIIDVNMKPRSSEIKPAIGNWILSDSMPTASILVPAARKPLSSKSSPQAAKAGKNPTTTAGA